MPTEPARQSAPTGLVTPSSEPQGQWSAVQTLPFVAISSILMDNGSFIFWDGWQQPQPSIVWDPAAPQTFTTLNAPDSVFCDGAAQLPDGRIIVVGGYGGLSTGQIGIVDTNIFDPSTNTWTRVANMNFPRWYPTLTEFANGRLCRDQRQLHRRQVIGRILPRSTTRRPIPGRCCRRSRLPRSTRRSTRSPTSSPTATCSRSGHPKTSPTR